MPYKDPAKQRENNRIWMAKNYRERARLVLREFRKKASIDGRCIKCGRQLHEDFDEGCVACIVCRAWRDKGWR